MMNSLLLLRLPVVSCFLVGSLVLNGCKKEGVISDPALDEISSTFASSDILFLPGEIQFISVEGYTLEEDQYAAEIEGGPQVVLSRFTGDVQKKTLVFFVPEVEVADHTLLFEIDGQKQTLDFSIEEYEVIEQPAVYVGAKKDQLVDQLTLMLNGISDEATRLVIEQSILDLDEALADFTTLDAADQRDLARLLSANLNLDAALAKMKDQGKSIATEHCDEITPRLFNAPERVLGISTMGVVSGSLWSRVKARVAHTFALARLKAELSAVIDDLGTAIKECVAPELTMESRNKSFGTAALVTYSFDHSMSREFEFTSTKTLDAALMAAINSIQVSISEFLAMLPDSWIDFLADSKLEKTEPANTASFQISSVSDSRISSQLSASGNLVTLTFAYQLEEMPVHTQSFSFTVGDAHGTLDVEAQLKPAPPVAYDGSFGTDIFESFEDTLSADYAGYFTIIAQPQYGTLTLTDAAKGIFVYEPNKTVTGGTDSFIFTASNDGGTSNESTFTIHLDNPFAGTWGMETFDGGYLLGEFAPWKYTETCNFLSIEYTYLSETLVINAESWSVSGTERVRYHNLTWDPASCAILEDGPDTIEDYPYSESSSYTRDGNVITTTLGGETVTGSITFLSDNKIQIGANTYVRQ